jgi:hypothetical protein
VQVDSLHHSAQPSVKASAQCITQGQESAGARFRWATCILLNSSAHQDGFEAMPYVVMVLAHHSIDIYMISFLTIHMPAGIVFNRFGAPGDGAVQAGCPRDVH